MEEILHQLRLVRFQNHLHMFLYIPSGLFGFFSSNSSIGCNIEVYCILYVNIDIVYIVKSLPFTCVEHIIPTPSAAGDMVQRTGWVVLA